MSRNVGAESHPQARTERLVVRRLDGEVLIYDRARDHASCLNGIAAAVWERCDGKTPPADIADALSATMEAKLDERVIWMALDKLSRAHLLEEAITLPPAMLEGTSRREFFRKVGVGVAVAIPAVTTILVPPAQAQGSCLPAGSACATSIQCCSGDCTGGVCVQL